MTLSQQWSRVLLAVLTALMLLWASPAFADGGGVSNNGGNNNDGDGIVNVDTDDTDDTDDGGGSGNGGNNNDGDGIVNS